MTLRLDMTKVKDFEQVDPLLREALMTACMVVGMNEITEANAQKLWTRVYAYEKVCGSIRTSHAPTTPEEVKRCIGLHINVSNTTDAAFARSMLKWATEDATREWRRSEERMTTVETVEQFGEQYALNHAQDPAGTQRPLKVIAKDIREHWAKVYFGAVPYLEAMAKLDTMEDQFGQDNAKSIVRYFLSNATTWRGEDARRIKAELKGMLKGVS